MSNEKKVIDISSDEHISSKPGPSKQPMTRKRFSKLPRYREYYLRGRPQKIALPVIMLPVSEPKGEQAEEEEDPEEEPEEAPRGEPEGESEEEEPFEECEMRAIEDERWGRDIVPSTSADSACSRVG